MDALPASVPEGELAIPLRIQGGRVASVTVRGTRRTDVASVLRGMPVRQALRMVPLLFSICGDAHTAAALDACEAALGVPAAQRTARRMICALEALDNHAFSVCVAWSKLAGQAPAVTPLLRVREATRALRRWAFAGNRWAEIGGAEIVAGGPSTTLVAELRDAIAEIAPEGSLTGDEDALRIWARASGSPAASLIHAVHEAESAGFRGSTAPLLPDLPASWFEARLASAAFSARPTLDGRPAESGPIARASGHPAVAAHLARSGRTLVPRFVARLCDMHALVGAVDEAARTLRAPSRTEVASRASGTGTGVADTARGRLAHRVDVDEDRVIAWRTVAPTEWSFHPDGVIREALLGAPAAGVERRASFLVAALDPCVACSVHVEEAADA